MAADDVKELPDVAQVLAPILERVSSEQRPLLIAIAERMAAQRYREWAEDPANLEKREGLLACAQREERIATTVEALYPDSEATQRDLLAKNPDAQNIFTSLFQGRSLSEQFKIQAAGERLGAATWRSLARDAEGPSRAAFEACASLEEESAQFLERSLLSIK